MSEGLVCGFARPASLIAFACSADLPLPGICRRGRGLRFDLTGRLFAWYVAVIIGPRDQAMQSHFPAPRGRAV